jgi:hypothetical protein
MRILCGISSPDPASLGAASSLVRRLKERSTLTSGKPPLGSKLPEDLQSRELRNAQAALFPRSGA